MPDNDEPITFPITIFNVKTRRIGTADGRRGWIEISNIDMADDQCGKDEGWVLGRIDGELFYIGSDAEPRKRGDGGPKDPGKHKTPPPPPPVFAEPADVKAEAARRIESVLPMWMVARAVSGGGPIPAEASAQAEAIRKASNDIEAMRPIPFDFDNDKWWP